MLIWNGILDNTYITGVLYIGNYLILAQAEEIDMGINYSAYILRIIIVLLTGFIAFQAVPLNIVCLVSIMPIVLFESLGEKNKKASDHIILLGFIAFIVLTCLEIYFMNAGVNSLHDLRLVYGE